MVRFWYRRKLLCSNSSDIQQNNLSSEQENKLESTLGKGRVQQELIYLAGNRNGTRIPVLVNKNWNGFQEFWFRLIQNGYDV